jgi:purine-binding chemotaxis protein CheW
MAGKRRSIDWDEVRGRLARAVQGEEATAALEERSRRIMDERARRLAEPAGERRSAAGSFEALVFSIGRTRYALPARFVREVTPLAQFTPVPGAPAPLLGVASHKGGVLAILQTRALLGGGESEDAPERQWLVVCGGRSADFALLADAVHELRRLDEDEAQAPLGAADAEGGAYVRGVTADALLLLDGAKLLADARLRIDRMSA